MCEICKAPSRTFICGVGRSIDLNIPCTRKKSFYQQRFLLSLLALISAFLHALGWISYCEDSALNLIMVSLGGIASFAIACLAAFSAVTFPWVSLLSVSWAAVWLVHSLFRSTEVGLSTDSALMMGTLAALAYALLPTASAVITIVVTYLLVCLVAYSMLGAPPLTLVNLGMLLVAITAASERSQRVLSERRKADQFRDLASRDGLTGLLNRTTTEKKAEAWLKRSDSSGYLIMLDLDCFKDINDKYGHVVGDSALKYAADVLRRVSTAGDIVGRWGGEEFLIILKGEDRDPFHVAHEIQELLSAAFVQGLPQLSASGGILSVSAGNDRVLMDLVRQVDARLYQAKEAGRGQFL